MELRMNPVQLPGPITFNYEELKAELTERLDVYRHISYTKEQLGEAKADRATLNRLKKALNDERLKQEREYMKPFSAFKGQVAEIIDIIDKSVSNVDKQVKSFEEDEREHKRAQIEAFFKDCKFPVAVRLEQIFDPKWLNATVKLDAIKEAITLRMEQCIEDIDVVRRLPEYAFEAEATYLATLDLRKALSEADRLRETARRKAQRAATVRESRTVEPAPAEAMRQWLTFKAHLTVEDARALRSFLAGRNIDFEIL